MADWQYKLSRMPAHLVNVANGDARSLLNALELAVETPPADALGIFASLAVAEESIQQRAVLYDKEGDAHFDTISAFIKNAALTRMQPCTGWHAWSMLARSTLYLPPNADSSQ